MKILYSNIPPLWLDEGQETILDWITDEFVSADGVDIAVGYISYASLQEIDRIVAELHIRHIRLIIGMYYIDGMPEKSYHAATAVNKKWKKAGIGEIRIVTTLKYHGKLYCFYKDGMPVSAALGSANLGVVKPEAVNRRQYELSYMIDRPEHCRDLAGFIDRLAEENCSKNIADITDMPLIREENTALSGVELVERIPPSAVDLYAAYKGNVSFVLPLKVPAFAERMTDDNRHYTKSNINVCYAAPRSKRKARDWYETQLTVSSEITRLEGYPEKNRKFFVVTDDGYKFAAHTTSAGNKQFSAVGDELIMGRWIKGRLAAAGLVAPVNNTKEDTERRGMITKEMLDAYGCSELVLTKTTQKAVDDEGAELDVWLLSFVSSVQG